MEEVCKRFSHLGENIFDSLDDKSITRCSKVSKFWRNYLSNQKFVENRKKFVEIQKIKAVVMQFHPLGDAWCNVFKTASTKTIMDLGMDDSRPGYLGYGVFL